MLEELTKSVHKAGIHVSFRCRPLNKSERAARQSVVVRSTEQGRVTLESNPNVNELDVQSANRITEKEYLCDEYFGPHQSTLDVFNGTAKQLVKPLIEGYNGSVFCYGPTGTGKTFTMFGTDQHPGVIRMLVDSLFKTQMTDFQTTIQVAAMELYNNEIRDLLSGKKNNIVNLKTNKKGKATVKGLKRFHANNVEEFMKLVKRAIEARITESTNANAQSSRSHCILQVLIKQNHFTTNVGRISKLNLIDLAGSERVKDTLIKRGPRMNEAVSINKSLLALKKCIRDLSSNKKFAPFRDSKLTRILQDSLQGGCITYMIACISQGSGQWHATRDTLEYATQARAIKQTKRRLKAPRVDLRVQIKQIKSQFNTLHDQKEKLEHENKELKKQLKQFEDLDGMDIETLEESFQNDIKALKREWALKMGVLDENLKKKESELELKSKELSLRNDAIKAKDETIAQLREQVESLNKLILDREAGNDSEMSVLVGTRKGTLVSVGEDESGTVAEVMYKEGDTQFVPHDQIRVVPDRLSIGSLTEDLMDEILEDDPMYTQESFGLVVTPALDNHLPDSFLDEHSTRSTPGLPDVVAVSTSLDDMQPKLDARFGSMKLKNAKDLFTLEQQMRSINPTVSENRRLQKIESQMALEQKGLSDPIPISKDVTSPILKRALSDPDVKATLNLPNSDVDKLLSAETLKFIRDGNLFNDKLLETSKFLTTTRKMKARKNLTNSMFDGHDTLPEDKHTFKNFQTSSKLSLSSNMFANNASIDHFEEVLDEMELGFLSGTAPPKSTMSCDRSFFYVTKQQSYSRVSELFSERDLVDAREGGEEPYLEPVLPSKKKAIVSSRSAPLGNRNLKLDTNFAQTFQGSPRASRRATSPVSLNASLSKKLREEETYLTRSHSSHVRTASQMYTFSLFSDGAHDLNMTTKTFNDKSDAQSEDFSNKRFPGHDLARCNIS